MLGETESFAPSKKGPNFAKTFQKVEILTDTSQSVTIMSQHFLKKKFYVRTSLRIRKTEISSREWLL